jgi:hypothetical protein
MSENGNKQVQIEYYLPCHLDQFIGINQEIIEKVALSDIFIC